MTESGEGRSERAKRNDFNPHDRVEVNFPGSRDRSSQPIKGEGVVVRVNEYTILVEMNGQRIPFDPTYLRKK